MAEHCVYTLILSDVEISTVTRSIDLRADSVSHYARSERAAGNVEVAQTLEAQALELANLAQRIREQVWQQPAPAGRPWVRG